MSTQTTTPNSIQWMNKAGVDAKDVAWLEGMGSSKELHLPEHSERVKQIYIDAISAVLSRVTSPAEFIRYLN